MSKDMSKEDILDRLETIREYIKDESISYDEIAELQILKDYIDKGDVELLQWAGVEENDNTYCYLCGTVEIKGGWCTNKSCAVFQAEEK